MGGSTDPVYIRVVEDLRVQIREGVLPPGTKVPSRFGIMKHYGVGETAAKHALAVLAAEGFIEPRSGSGSYVRQQQEIARLDHDLSRLPGSPFGFGQRTRPAGAGPAGAGPAASAGQEGQAGPGGPNGNGHMAPLSWEHQSDRIPAPPHIGRRLRLQGDDGVVRTRYVLRRGPSPVQLATSYEPLQLTAGTPVAQPESGPAAGQGVIARMAAIGIQVDEVVEEIASRPPFSGEAAALEIPPGTRVMHIERSHLAGGRPVETCDIVLAAERYRLRYRFPVPGGHDTL
jgi:DNA-binding GntR family transcriptional regulator